MELRIYLRHTQNYALFNQSVSGLAQGDPIVYAGLTPSSLSPQYGIVPHPDWIDFTTSVGNLDKLKLTFTTERNGSGGVAQTGELRNKKSASNSIIITDEAYKFIREWLIDNISAPFNSIDVRIDDVGCGSYTDYVIRATQIQWCENEICQFEITIRSADDAIKCIEQTVISDNWQGMFHALPLNGKKHPRFDYCIEARPNGMLVFVGWLISSMATTILPMMMSFSMLANSILLIWNIIVWIWEALSWLFGGDPPSNPFDSDNYLDPFAPFEWAAMVFLRAAGCERQHPAPLIRDYIQNVCDKCGVKVDEVTAPIFFAQKIFIETGTTNYNGEGAVWKNNPYYWACYLTAPAKRGIKKYINSGIFVGGGDLNMLQYIIPENLPILSLDMFLDQIKGVFNADWTIKNIDGVPYLYFWRKDWYNADNYVYDFAQNSADRDKIIKGICYNWNDSKQPAAMIGIYSTDVSDLAANESQNMMNSIISLGDGTNNQTTEGILDKTQRAIGLTKFRHDGLSADYLYDALQVIVNGQATNPLNNIWADLALYDRVQEYDYSILLGGHMISQPRIIIWDNVTPYEFAKATRNKFYSINMGGAVGVAQPAPFYNPTSLYMEMLHPPHCFVEGNGMQITAATNIGAYNILDLNGADVMTPAMHVNYPMYFQYQFQDNLFDWFHWIDDPRRVPNLNLNWNVKIELCCDDLQKLKVFDNGVNVSLFNKIKLPLLYYPDGKITEVTVSYDSTDTYGKYIEIKGTT